MTTDTNPASKIDHEAFKGATPGPWFQSHRKNLNGMYSTEVYDANGETIATIAWYLVKTAEGTTKTAREANAALIAAAPALAVENERLVAALMTIAQFPITDMRGNQDAVNMQDIAIKAIGVDHAPSRTQQPEDDHG